MPRDLAQSAKLINQAMAGDRFRLRKRLRAIEQARQSGKPHDRSLGKLQRELDESIQTLKQRRASAPKIELPDELPITSRAQEIIDAVREHQVVVVAGETGSGKSTQLPKLMLKMGRGVEGLIGHTQPRRLAARSVAQRVSEELSSPLGQDVGYKVRFADKTNPKTYIKLMTDGVLLAEAARDRFFDAYDTLIIDEAHERSLNIDFLLGHIRQILPKRPDLRVIITSATIDTRRFAEHFGVATRGGLEPAPVIEVSGRTYPVEVRYEPIEPDEYGEVPDESEAVAQAIEGLDRAGDVLVFMPTERDIRDCCGLLERRQPASEVLPLYARLTNAQQQAIFAKSSKRKIVVATNVAESSLTVPGIRYVVDTGTARVSRYSPNSKVQRLPIEAVSQASCDQRKGRCGRVGPGVCVRLYSKDDFEARDEFTTPEILRSNLASVILQIETLRFGAIQDFPFIDPPRPSMVRDGYKTLHEIGALTDDDKVSALGRQLSHMPVDPRVARMVLAGQDGGVMEQVLVIASALELQDPRERPMDQQGKADQAHEQFADPRSDFLSYLKLWSFYHEQKAKLSHNKLRKACKQNFLNDVRMREWVDVHQQLKRMVKELHPSPRGRGAGGEGRGSAEKKKRDGSSHSADSPLTPSPSRGERGQGSEVISDAKADAIHRALLTGLLSNIASKGDGFEYNGAGGQKLNLWPGSSLFASKPKWVVAAELVETTRRYARTVGQIQPGMIEPIAGHLVKKTHSDPRWVRETGSAMCSERVSLYGLVLVRARPVPLARVNPAEARQMFIQCALVEGEWDCDLPFFQHNREQLEQARSLEAKARRHGLVAADDVRYAFYDERLPETVVDGATLKKWLKGLHPSAHGRRGEGQASPKPLHMELPMLLAQAAEDVTETAYPDRLQVEQASHKFAYTFDPGDERDGLTLTLPREALGQLDARRLGWLVPGMLEQKLVALTRTLPKGLRKTLSPAPIAARKAIEHLQFGSGSFEDAAAQALAKVGGLNLSASDFDLASLPDAFKMNVRVVGEQGQTLAEGRDLGAVRRKLGAGALPSYAGMDDPRYSAPPATEWSFGDLPKHVDTTRSGVDLRAYPALIDETTDVALRLVDTRTKARRLTRGGLRRLFSFEVQRDFVWRADHWPGVDKLRLWFASIGDPAGLRDQLVLRMTERAFLFDKEKIESEEAFITRQRVGLQRLDIAEREVRRVVAPVLEAAQHARLAVDRADFSAAPHAKADLRIQLNNLLSSSFLIETPWARLASYPRYLAAINRRLEKLKRGGAPQDAAAFKEVAEHWNRYARAQTALAEQGGFDPELEQYRWLIEELRVSLFAQELGTSEKVSPKRLDRQWEKVAR
ncbi:MAG: ATP-dependent RNA helicase HrpA [Phycisphaeraceae bacterium]|nr:ATP-dependent RNA helicase HrpA [Phycisphaeraceae bacterium]